MTFAPAGRLHPWMERSSIGRAAASLPPESSNPGAPGRGGPSATRDRRRPGDSARLFLALLGAALAAALAPHVCGKPPPVAVVPVRIDLDRATAGVLRALPGVGRVLASRIVVSRAERPFESVEDLLRVPGVGPSLVARISRHAVAGTARREGGSSARHRGAVDGAPPSGGAASVESTGRVGDPRR